MDELLRNFVLIACVAICAFVLMSIALPIAFIAFIAMMRKLIKGKRTIACLAMIMGLLLCSMHAMAATKPSALDKVRAIAGTHAVTTAHRNGVYWVEVEGSDIFGTGSTLEEAVDDFLADADLEAHELNKPHLKTLPTKETSTIDCLGEYCL